MSIVLVDDEAATNAIHKRYAKKLRGVEAMAFTDATEAVAHLEKTKADLIVVDYSMPKMDGIAFIQAVRAGAHNKETPIVMVTSSAFESLKGKAMIAGAQAFVAKPLSMDDFKDRVLSFLP